MYVYGWGDEMIIDIYINMDLYMMLYRFFIFLFVSRRKSVINGKKDFVVVWLYYLFVLSFIC